MEKWKVVGYRRCEFDSRDNAQIKGYTLFLAREPQSSRIVGLEVLKLFISDFVGYTPKENETVFITYNRYGKVAQVTPEV